MKRVPGNLFVSVVLLISLACSSSAQKIPVEFTDPPRKYSVLPFWFWNDTLKDSEIIRQIKDFEDHGVYGFVIHPRIGLPESVRWLGPEMLHAMRVAISEAARRNMYVVLYDEGMYPSGSSSGQVVEQNPEYASRGLVITRLDKGEKPAVPEGARLLSLGEIPGSGSFAIIDRPSGGTIRGLHYIGEGKPGMKEETPPSADILNPGAVKSFIGLVYETYAKEFGEWFGTTIIGIFTDEPGILGRGGEKGMVPGSSLVLPEISRIAGYDFKPFLADLFPGSSADSGVHRADYFRAINQILGETYYKALGEWCKAHGIALMGHPAGSMDIALEKYFGIPGQDLVWRYVEPGRKALAGEHSTMAKCASSAMVHLRLERNSNELYGAYGHNLTWEEMNWLAGWCFVRGQNMLFPHAFYYSIRGPRYDERPPDVGPNASWWSSYRGYADMCRRLSWINSDSRQVCSLAILCGENILPEKAAETLLMNQVDFNYLESGLLLDDAVTDKHGIHIAGMDYGVLVIDSLPGFREEITPQLKMLAANGKLIIRNNPALCSGFPGAIDVRSGDELLASVRRLEPAGPELSAAAPGLRYRHVIKEGCHFFLLFNEGDTELITSVKVPVTGKTTWLDPVTGRQSRENRMVRFRPWEMKILMVRS